MTEYQEKETQRQLLLLERAKVAADLVAVESVSGKVRDAAEDCLVRYFRDVTAED